MTHIRDVCVFLTQPDADKLTYHCPMWPDLVQRYLTGKPSVGSSTFCMRVMTVSQGTSFSLAQIMRHAKRLFILSVAVC